VVSGRDGKGSSQHQPKSDVVIESSVDRVSVSEFRRGERVYFHSKHGVKHYGVVRWTGRENRTKKLEHLVVGIQTVSCEHIAITLAKSLQKGQ
jgi:hypothetical protein